MQQTRDFAIQIIDLLGVKQAPFIINGITDRIEEFLKEYDLKHTEISNKAYEHLAVTLENKTLDVSEAVNVLGSALEEDEELYISYQSNIASCIKTKRHLHTDMNDLANAAAKMFLDMFINTGTDIFTAESKQRESDQAKWYRKGFEDSQKEKQDTISIKDNLLEMAAQYLTERTRHYLESVFEMNWINDYNKIITPAAATIKNFSENDLSPENQEQRIKSMERTIASYTYLLRKSADLMKPSGDVEPGSLQAEFSKQIIENLKSSTITDNKEEGEAEKGRDNKNPSRVYAQSIDFVAFLDRYANEHTSFGDWYELSIKTSPEALNKEYREAVRLYNEEVVVERVPEVQTSIADLSYNYNQDAGVTFVKTLYDAGYSHASATAWNVNNGLRIIRYITDVARISINHPDRLPTYEEIQWARDLFGAHIKQMALVFVKDDKTLQNGDTLTLIELIYK